MLPYNVAVLCGEKNVDYWDEKQWLKELEDHEILVATAQVILDALNRKFLLLEQINVIVFDECHHGKTSRFR
jgi:endoribonuclease Dicer